VIGEKAPSFVAETTQGKIRFPDDYKGKWVVFFSHPADFTPVCTTEFMTFAAQADEFKKLNAQLLGLSIDSTYSHIAWLRTIKEKIEYKGMKSIEVNFPVISDLTMERRSSGCSSRRRARRRPCAQSSSSTRMRRCGRSCTTR
jgi:peroxiredoxin (alkyl hydroperoxide reductase subunit C)